MGWWVPRRPGLICKERPSCALIHSSTAYPDIFTHHRNLLQWNFLSLDQWMPLTCRPTAQKRGKETIISFLVPVIEIGINTRQTSVSWGLTLFDVSHIKTFLIWKRSTKGFWKIWITLWMCMCDNCAEWKARGGPVNDLCRFVRVKSQLRSSTSRTRKILLSVSLSSLPLPAFIHRLICTHTVHNIQTTPWSSKFVYWNPVVWNGKYRSYTMHKYIESVCISHEKEESVYVVCWGKIKIKIKIPSLRNFLFWL